MPIFQSSPTGLAKEGRKGGRGREGGRKKRQMKIFLLITLYIVITNLFI